MPSMQRNHSAPSLHTLSSLSRPHVSEQRRRKSTLLNPSDYYDPRSILQIILSQPNHALIGITPNLRPLIESTITELRDLDSSEQHQSDPKLIDDILLRLEIEQYKSFSPLEASIQNFESILDQKYTSHLIYAVCHALVGSFLSGFNTSLLNIPALLIQSECHLTISAFSSLQSMYCVGGLFGALFAGYMADSFGRQPTLFLANALFMISGLLSMLFAFEFFGPITESVVYLIMSRSVSGVASGISTAIVPTYLGEIAPPLIRGEIGTLNAFINSFGILFAEIIGFEYILGNAAQWKYLFTVNVIPFCVQFMFLRSFCESPQWHLLKDKEKEARRVFMWLRESNSVELDMKSLDTKSNASLLSDVAECDEYGAVTTNQKQEDKRTVLIYIFFVCIMLQILQQLSGINSVWYYSSMMLKGAGLKSPLLLWIGNVLIASTNFFGVLIPVQLIEKIGRKLLIYLSCFGMIIASVLLSMVLMFANDIGSLAGYLSISLLVFYVISFAVGLGPIVGLLTVELAPSSHRGTIVSVAFFINYSANLCIAQYTNEVVKYLYYMPFAAVCLLGIMFTFMCVIETQAKTETEIQLELLRKVKGEI
eukprot:41454_1